MLAGMYRGPGRAAVASSSARLYDMIATQPVFYEFEQIKPPTLLLVGDKDTTAIGKDTAPPEIRKTLGNYPVLGKEAVKRIPHAQLIEFPDLGHSPQIQAPARFHEALLGWLQHPETGATLVKQRLARLFRASPTQRLAWRAPAPWHAPVTIAARRGPDAHGRACALSGSPHSEQTITGSNILLCSSCARAASAGRARRPCGCCPSARST